MIYTIGGIKGGSGKTTIATNWTVLLSASGRDVILVDADDQETATDFTAWRNERMGGNAGYTAIQLREHAVRTEVIKLKDKYDDIVIDTGGRDTASQRAALTVADVYLIPFIPRSFDVWTVEKVETLIDEIRVVNPDLKAFAFLNRADPRGTDNAEATECLQESPAFSFLFAPLGNRKAFSNAAAQGMGVTEIKPRDRKAVTELKTLFKQCAEAIQPGPDNVKNQVKTHVKKGVKSWQSPENPNEKHPHPQRARRTS